MLEPKIIIFNGFYLPHLGGVERYTSNLVQKLKKDYSIVIVTTNVPNSPYYEKLDGVEIYRLPVFKLFKDRYPILKRNKSYHNLLKKIYNIYVLKLSLLKLLRIS